MDLNQTIETTCSISERLARKLLLRASRRAMLLTVAAIVLFVAGIAVFWFSGHREIRAFLSVESFGGLLLLYSRFAERDCKFYLKIFQDGDAARALVTPSKQSGIADQDVVEFADQPPGKLEGQHKALTPAHP